MTPFLGVPPVEGPLWPPSPTDQRISVVISVSNESRRIASVVRPAVRSPGVGEVLVVDDGSIDGTPEPAEAAGAKVITNTMPGKGASMDDGLRAARHETLV